MTRGSTHPSAVLYGDLLDAAVINRLDYPGSGIDVAALETDNHGHFSGHAIKDPQYPGNFPLFSGSNRWLTKASFLPKGWELDPEDGIREPESVLILQKIFAHGLRQMSMYRCEPEQRPSLPKWTTFHIPSADFTSKRIHTNQLNAIEQLSAWAKGSNEAAWYLLPRLQEQLGTKSVSSALVLIRWDHSVPLSTRNTNADMLGLIII